MNQRFVTVIIYVRARRPVRLTHEYAARSLPPSLPCLLLDRRQRICQFVAMTVNRQAAGSEGFSFSFCYSFGFGWLRLRIRFHGNTRQGNGGKGEAAIANWYLLGECSN